MSKKPHKVDDPASGYATGKPAKRAGAASKSPAEEFRRISGKLFGERKELLRKLAQ